MSKYLPFHATKKTRIDDKIVLNKWLLHVWILQTNFCYYIVSVSKLNKKLHLPSFNILTQFIFTNIEFWRGIIRRGGPIFWSCTINDLYIRVQTLIWFCTRCPKKRSVSEMISYFLTGFLGHPVGWHNSRQNIEVSGGLFQPLMLLHFPTKH